MENNNTDMSVAYQNKDIIAKMFGEQMKGKPLSLFGVKNDKKVVSIQPTNIPLLKLKELRIDNLFELEDEGVAIVDYESTYEEEDFLKYGVYVLEVWRRYLQEGKRPDIHMIVIYTADIEKTKTELHRSALDIRVEAAYLVGVDSEEWLEEVERSIREKVITDEVLMHLVLLPLTYKGDADKQAAIKKCVNLAKDIEEEDKKRFALAGILAFADKIISEETKRDIKEVLKMNQVIKMIFDEGVEEGIEKGIEKGGEMRAAAMARKMLQAGEAREKIREYTGLSEDAVKALEEDACCLV